MISHRIARLVPWLVGLALLFEPVFGQKKGKRTDDILRILADEVSGEEAFQNVAALAGWPRLRTEGEYTGTFFEASRRS